MRSSKGAAVGLVAVGGLLAILAAGRTWLSVTPVGATVSVVRGAVPVPGQDAAPAAAALGLVALAAAVALLVSGPVVRYVVGAAVALCGGGLVAVPVVFATGGVENAALDAVARVTGARGTGSAGFTAVTTVWPTICAAAGLLVLAGGVVALVRGRTWGGVSRRYESPAAGAAAPAPAAAPGADARDRAYDTWDALSDGTDPTADDPPRA